MRPAKSLFAMLTSLLVGAAMAAPSDIGKAVYDGTCIACHGADGMGALPGAPDFRRKDGPLTKSDAILIKHITQGFKGPDSPMAMPPKGGNPALTDREIREVLRYIRQKFGKP